MTSRMAGDQWATEEKIRSSLIKFSEGGIAILARVAVSHHALARGRIMAEPRRNNMARLLVRS